MKTGKIRSERKGGGPLDVPPGMERRSITKVHLRIGITLARRLRQGEVEAAALDVSHVDPDHWQRLGVAGWQKWSEFVNEARTGRRSAPIRDKARKAARYIETNLGLELHRPTRKKLQVVLEEAVLNRIGER